MASQAADSLPSSPCDFVDHESEDRNTAGLQLLPDAVRMVGIRIVAGEHLVSPAHNTHTHRVSVQPNINFNMNSQGVTFKVEGGDLVIARILHGGMIDQQGLLHVGDVIKEVRSTNASQMQQQVTSFGSVSVLQRCS